MCMCFSLTLSVSKSYLHKIGAAYELLVELSSREVIWHKILKLYVLANVGSLPLLVNPIEILRDILKDLCKT